MNCEEQNAIKIFRGDDTNWNGGTLLHFKVTSPSVDLSTMTAEFILGSIVKSNIPLDEGGEFDVNYSHAETSSLPWGPNKGVLKIFDSEGRIKTVSNSILFFVTSQVVGEQGETIIVPLPETSPVQIELTIGGGSGGGSWGSITGDIQDQEDLQAEFDTKMDKSGGTFTGDVTLSQGVSLKTQVGELHDVNDNIVLGGKDTNYGLYVAPDGTAAALVGNNSLKDIITTADVKSTYSASGTDPVNGQAVSSAISTKQDTISDLSTIRSGAALGATAVQPATLESELATKQDTLTTTQLEAVNSGANSTNIGQISTNTSSITGIESKIPAQASTENQLADKNFVNSSVATNTANFIGTFNSVADLEAYSGTLTNNDYAFVISTDSAGNTVYNRYKYTTATDPASWQFEYALNNSSFTANQWAAINSGATTTNIGQIATNTSDITSLQTNKLDVSTAASTYATQSALSTGLATKASTADGVTITDSGSAISTVAVKEQNDNTAIKQWVGTKAEYDLIATKNEDTLYIITDDNQGGGGTDLESIDGYDANVPVQRLANLCGNFKWQTKSVVCDNFNQYNYLTPKITWPETVNTVDLIIELTAFIPDTSEYPQNLIIFNPQGTSSSLFYGGYQHNPRGGFGYWNGTSNVWYNDTITQTPATKWIRLTGTNGNLSVYCLDDNNYTLETLPELASWTYQGVCTETFGNSTSMQFSNNNAGAFKGVLKNWQIKANDSVVFDLRNDNSVNLTNSNTQAYKTAMGIQITESWN